ncbi:MAG: hypothetical protein HQ575_05405, partial [Candidatus Omnitrophica bacterium]|nr:hypothetical protein [Candidatus Omnitrophota bacterium]
IMPMPKKRPEAADPFLLLQLRRPGEKLSDEDKLRRFSVEDINRQFRKLLKICHPDVNPPELRDKANKVIKALVIAREKAIRQLVRLGTILPEEYAERVRIERKMEEEEAKRHLRRKKRFLPAPSSTEQEDSFIIKGEEAKEELARVIAEGEFKEYEIRDDLLRYIENLFVRFDKTYGGQPGMEKIFASVTQAIEDLTAKRIIAFKSIVLGSRDIEGQTDQFALGFGSEDMLGYADDLLRNLSLTSDHLPCEYLLHEALCARFGHEKAREVQRLIFPMNYPDDKKYPEGMLREFIREFINKRAQALKSPVPSAGSAKGSDEYIEPYAPNENMETIIDGMRSGSLSFNIPAFVKGDGTMAIYGYYPEGATSGRRIPIKLGVFPDRSLMRGGRGVVISGRLFKDGCRGITIWAVDDKNEKAFPIVSYKLYKEGLFFGKPERIFLDLEGLDEEEIPSTKDLAVAGFLYWAAKGENAPEVLNFKPPGESSSRVYLYNTPKGAVRHTFDMSKVLLKNGIRGISEVYGEDGRGICYWILDEEGVPIIPVAGYKIYEGSRFVTDPVLYGFGLADYEKGDYPTSRATNYDEALAVMKLIYWLATGSGTEPGDLVRVSSGQSRRCASLYSHGGKIDHYIPSIKDKYIFRQRVVLKDGSRGIIYRSLDAQGSPSSPLRGFILFRNGKFLKKAEIEKIPDDQLQKVLDKSDGVRASAPVARKGRAVNVLIPEVLNTIREVFVRAIERTAQAPTLAEFVDAVRAKHKISASVSAMRDGIKKVTGEIADDLQIELKTLSAYLDKRGKRGILIVPYHLEIIKEAFCSVYRERGELLSPAQLSAHLLREHGEELLLDEEAVRRAMIKLIPALSGELSIIEAYIARAIKGERPAPSDRLPDRTATVDGQEELKEGSLKTEEIEDIVKNAWRSISSADFIKPEQVAYMTPANLCVIFTEEGYYDDKFARMWFDGVIRLLNQSSAGDAERFAEIIFALWQGKVPELRFASQSRHIVRNLESLVALASKKCLLNRPTLTLLRGVTETINKSASEGSPNNKAPSGDGYIIKGEEARRRLDEVIEAEDFVPLDIPEGALEYLYSFPEALADRLQKDDLTKTIADDIILALEDIKKKRKVGFESIVLSSQGVPGQKEDQFALGFWNKEKDILGYATDLLEYLGQIDGRFKTNLVAEYILHEALCARFGHQPARDIQRAIFSENYPDDDIYSEGLLREVLRYFVNSRASIPSWTEILNAPSDGEILNLTEGLTDERYLSYFERYSEPRYESDTEVRNENISTVMDSLTHRSVALVLGYGSINQSILQDFDQVILVDMNKDALRHAWNNLSQELRKKTYLVRTDASWLAADIIRVIERIEGKDISFKDAVRIIAGAIDMCRNRVFPYDFADLVISERTYYDLEKSLLEYIMRKLEEMYPGNMSEGKMKKKVRDIFIVALKHLQVEQWHKILSEGGSAYLSVLDKLKMPMKIEYIDIIERWDPLFSAVEEFNLIDRSVDLPIKFWSWREAPKHAPVWRVRGFWFSKGASQAEPAQTGEGGMAVRKDINRWIEDADKGDGEALGRLIGHIERSVWVNPEDRIKEVEIIGVRLQGSAQERFLKGVRRWFEEDIIEILKCDESRLDELNRRFRELFNMHIIPCFSEAMVESYLSYPYHAKRLKVALNGRDAAYSFFTGACKKMGWSIREIYDTVFELCYNVRKHGGGGIVLLRNIYSGTENIGIEIVARDKGPGIGDAEEARKRAFLPKPGGIGFITIIGDPSKAPSVFAKEGEIVYETSDGSTGRLFRYDPDEKRFVETEQVRRIEQGTRARLTLMRKDLPEPEPAPELDVGKVETPEGVLPEFMAGRKYCMRINRDQATAGRYETALMWWSRLSRAFPQAEFDLQVIENANKENGFVEITCTKNVRDEATGVSYEETHSGAVKVTNPDRLDETRTLLKILNMAFIASNVPDVDSREYTADVEVFLRFINSIYRSIKGEELFRDDTISSSPQEVIDLIRHIEMELPDAEPVDYDKQLELNNAIETLKAV